MGPKIQLYIGWNNSIYKGEITPKLAIYLTKKIMQSMNITIRNGRCFRNPAFTSWGLVVYPIIYKVYDHPRRLAGTPKPKQGSTLRVSRLISEGRNSWNTGSPVSTSCTSLTYHGPPGLVWNLGFFAMDRCLKENLKISNRSWWPKICRKRASLG